MGTRMAMSVSSIRECDIQLKRVEGLNENENENDKSMNNAFVSGTSSALSWRPFIRDYISPFFFP